MESVQTAYEPTITLASPAKINLFLAITGLREDGYHNLISLATPLAFGDALQINLTQDKKDLLICDDPAVPVDETNLILRAIKAYRAIAPFEQGVTIHLTKRIPMGAGLGGGSSNATTTLLGLNRLLNEPLSQKALSAMAANIGSDCPLFLEQKPVIMRGRGEDVLSCSFPKTDIGVLLFKPYFSINTEESYGLIKKSTENYLIEEKAELCFKRFFDSLLAYCDKNAPLTLYNNLETVIARKYPIIQALLQSLRSRFQIPCLMSGSGSTCFLLYKKNNNIAEIKRHIRNILGEKAFIVETTFL